MQSAEFRSERRKNACSYFCILQSAFCILHSGDLKDDLSRFTRLDHPHRVLESLQRKSVSNYRRRIELTGKQEARHLVPRVVHAPADHSVDRDALEADLIGEVYFYRLRRDAEHLDASAKPNHRKSLVNRR